MAEKVRMAYHRPQTHIYCIVLDISINRFWNQATCILPSQNGNHIMISHQLITIADHVLWSSSCLVIMRHHEFTIFQNCCHHGCLWTHNINPLVFSQEMNDIMPSHMAYFWLARSICEHFISSIKLHYMAVMWWYHLLSANINLILSSLVCNMQGRNHWLQVYLSLDFIIKNGHKIFEKRMCNSIVRNLVWNTEYVVN